MTSELPSVLTVGDASDAEMQSVTDVLAELIPRNQLFQVPDLVGLQTLLDSKALFPDLVIAFQSWPDQYCPDDVGRLFQRLPLANIICCYGSWCDSDGRNRRIWPPATRVPAFSAAGLIRQLWNGLSSRNAPLPLTASLEEVFARLHSEKIPPQLGLCSRETPACVGIQTADGAIRDWLSDALNCAGFTLDQGNHDLADAILWDAPVWDEHTAQDLCKFHSRYPKHPLIALIGGVRPQHIQQARSCGASRVLAKLSPVTNIMAELSDLIRECSAA